VLFVAGVIRNVSMSPAFGNKFIAIRRDCTIEIRQDILDEDDGFQDPGGTYRPYGELRKKNPAMRPRGRKYGGHRL
jgi:hypothetical protein